MTRPTWLDDIVAADDDGESIAEMDAYFEKLYEQEHGAKPPWSTLTRLQRNRQWRDLAEKYGAPPPTKRSATAYDVRASRTTLESADTPRPTMPAMPYTEAEEWVRLPPCPDGYRSQWHWMLAGITRQVVPAGMALVVSWSACWLVLWIAMVAALIGAGAGLIVSLGITSGLPITIAGQTLALQGLAPIAAVAGAITLFSVVIVSWLTVIVVEGGVPFFLGLAMCASFCAAFVVLASVVEPVTMRIRGNRRLSIRERQRIATPDEGGRRDVIGRVDDGASGLLVETAAQMKLSTIPRVLVDCSAFDLNAWTHIQHIVLSEMLGLHDEAIELDDEELCAVLAHELHHWRNGDIVGRHFLWACSLPVVLLYNFAVNLSGGPTDKRKPQPPPSKSARAVLTMLGWMMLWPTWVLLRVVIQPSFAAHFRRQEYAADRAAVDAGYGEGLRRFLERKKSFEAARSGWEALIVAVHPPTELRLEAIALRMEELTEEPNSGNEINS